MSSTLLELGIDALEHKDEVEEVKRRMGITHEHFDCWVYNFLQNKNFNVDETVAKLERRAAMEVNELANIEVTDYMRENMLEGVIQFLGFDKDGRLTFYIVTSRDFPSSDVRDERRRVFDMWLMWGTRLRRNDKRCRCTLLINQKDAGVWSNTDMTFQSNVALRIAKYYPGAFDKMYVCSMGRALAAFAGPIIRRMPSAISDRVFIYNEKEINNGAMLQFFDDDVLPVALGGSNAVDGPESWKWFAETVQAHYLKVRSALLQGISVKDWELQEVKKEEEEEERALQSSVRASRPPMTPSQRSLVPSFDARSATMMSCLSDQDAAAEGDYLDRDEFNTSHRLRDWDVENISSLNEGKVAETLWLLEEQESFFRKNFEQLQEMQFLSFGERFVSDRRRKENEGLLGGTGDRIAMSCPGPARSVTRGFIWVLCVLIAVYFVAATIFAQVVACAIMVLMFVGIFLKPFYVYPLGLTLLLVGYEACLIGSRGFELAQATFRGKLIRPLKKFGYGGLIAQSIFFFLIIVIQLAFFTYYAATVDPLTGLSVSFSVGWMACAGLLCIAHLGFPLGLTYSSEQTAGTQKHSITGLSLYLFLDLSEMDEDSRVSSRTSMVVFAGVPVAVAFLFGVGFIQSELLFFLISATILTVISAFFTIYFVEGTFQDHSSNLIRSATWLLMVFWLFTVYAMGFKGWKEGFGNSVVISAVVCVFFVLLTAFAVVVKNPRYQRNVLRVGYGFLLILVVVGVVVAWVVHWGLGLFATIMFIHALACFLRVGAISMVGSLTATLGGIAVFLAVVLLGWVAVEDEYGIPRSVVRPPSPSDLQTSSDLDDFFEQQLHPVCLRKFGTLTPTDFALFSELGYAGPLTRDVDLQTWVPDYEYRGEMTFPAGVSVDIVKVLILGHKTSNDTVFVLRGSQDRMIILQSMTIWVESLALTPFSLVLPRNWTSGIIQATSFGNELLPFRWETQVNHIISEVKNYGKSRAGNFYLTGHGFGGGIAAIVGARAQIPTVVFSSPGILYSRLKLHVRQWDLFRFVTSIVTTNGALSAIDTHGESVQRLVCDDGLVPCQDIRWMACRLLNTCRDQGNRSHTLCG